MQRTLSDERSDILIAGIKLGNKNNKYNWLSTCTIFHPQLHIIGASLDSWIGLWFLLSGEFKELSNNFCHWP